MALADETTPVRPGHAIDRPRLLDYLTRHVPGIAADATVRQFRGGQSNPTFLVESGGRAFVLRKKPPGVLLPSAHAVDREYAVMKALAGTEVPVPKMLHLCQDDAILGTAFYIMEWVDGRVFWEPGLPGLSPAERHAVYDAMNEVLARLHKVDYRAVGLDGFGRPGNYFERQISRWSKQYRASETERIEAMDRLIEWLPENIPPGDETAVVHGDYRLDNMIFHAGEPRILAVLDWELSTLGHPLGDFTYQLIGWRLSGGLFRGVADLDLAALGIPTEAEYIAAYCRRTGREGVANLEWYLAYNMFRLACILQGIMGRALDGTAASEHAVEQGRRAKPMAEAAWRQIAALAG